MERLDVGCPNCGTRVPYKEGDTEVTCPECGTQINLLTALEAEGLAEAGETGPGVTGGGGTGRGGTR